MSEEKKVNPIAKMLDGHQAAIGHEVAMRALTLVKPMIKDVCKQLSESLGDNDQIIVIRKINKNSPVLIHLMNSKEDFTIQGGENFSFTGTKKSVNKMYVAEEFVELLLTGKMKELTEKIHG